MDYSSILVLSETLRNDLARGEAPRPEAQGILACFRIIGCLAHTLELEGKMKLFLIMIVDLKKG